MMASEWYIRDLSGRVRGPITTGDLQALATFGEISRKTDVRNGREGRWVAAATVRGLFEEPQSSLPTKKTHRPTAPSRADPKVQPTPSHRLRFAMLYAVPIMALVVAALFIWRQEAKARDEAAKRHAASLMESAQKLISENNAADAAPLLDQYINHHFAHERDLAVSLQEQIRIALSEEKTLESLVKLGVADFDQAIKLGKIEDGLVIDERLLKARNETIQRIRDAAIQRRADLAVVEQATENADARPMHAPLDVVAAEVMQENDPKSKPAPEPIRVVGLVGDETALVRVKADPERFRNQEFIIVGGVRIDDVFISSYYSRQRDRYTCLVFAESGATLGEFGSEIAWLYGNKSDPTTGIDKLIDLEAATKTRDVYQLVRARVKFNSRAFREDKQWNELELVELQFPNEDLTGWEPWGSEIAARRMAEAAKRQAEVEAAARKTPPGKWSLHISFDEGERAGRFGNCGQFKRDSLIDYPVDWLPTGDSARSIMFWVRSSQDTADVVPLRWGRLSSGDATYLFITSINRGDPKQPGGVARGRIVCGNVGGGASEFGGGPKVNDGEWHHIGLVYDGQGAASLYVDGNQVARASRRFRTSFSKSLVLGRYDGGSSMVGQLDDLLILDRAVTEDELRRVMKDGAVEGLLKQAE
jgi:hypothetical protein